MITTKYVRDNFDAIKKSLEKRKSDFPIDELKEYDEKSRKLMVQVQKLRSDRNKGSEAVSNAKKQGKEPSKEELEKLASTKEQIDELESQLEQYQKKIESLLWNLPNVLHESVPYGKDSSDNVEVRKWGTIKTQTTKNHVDVLGKLGLVDLDQASKVSGARFYYLKGDIALLEQSLIRFAIDELTGKGYTLIAPPLMLKREYYRGVTTMGDFEEMLYKVAEPGEAKEKADYEHVNDELFMIATSEHPLAAMYAGKVLSAKELPKKFVGVSPCFRREAGAHGKDTKGIFRVHQFYKVEQFVFSRQEDSWDILEEIVKNSEMLNQKLGLPYRVVNICTGDIGSVAAKKYDIEAYMPSQGQYREVVSCSNCTDWQSLRLDIKYDEGNERKYVHTLNGTAIATTRTMVAIIENYANDDGTITVPDVLVPYMHKNKIG
ncbi:MAG: serine--tRNA ligase [Candidatus Micrarchaeaceae archaeon]